ncbi:TetR family transcriptional regulator [Bacillus arachidis]|uniref:TetR family transcriptional regulator n=1 Tax=Bacillus arachidis TaxID=2819290 RepID=A0ABS3NZ65_9BACI|nr:TetR family transcriptional regulator [Bacillus arachidis]MBO1626244.1 TetR family transcriptional regulator [Bacillus arachidis]
MMSKKEKIVYAAIECFREKGIEKTKISDIVKSAGIAQGTFYLYFSSKLSVVPAIAEVMVEKMIRAVEEKTKNSSSFLETFSQIVDAIFDFTKEHYEIQALIYLGLASTEHIKKWENVYQPLYIWIKRFLEEAKEANVVRNSIHVERTSKLFIALVESAAEQIYLYDHVKEEEANLQKAEILDFLTHALHIRK